MSYAFSPSRAIILRRGGSRNDGDEALNGLYIGIGMTLILALLAALIGPFFVDWDSHRAVFEREAAKIVGFEVTVIGDVDVRLLPSPRVRFGDVVVGPVEKPLLRVGRFELDLEAAPLLRGDARVSELRLERPVLDLVLDRDGRPRLPPRTAEARDAASVAIDQVEISEGRLTVTDERGGGRFEIGRIAAVGSAQSLAGPWRLDGGGLRAGRELSFHLAGGRAADGATAVKLQVTPGDDPVTLTADLAFREGGGPTVSGRVAVERRGADAAGLAGALATWRAEAQIGGDAAAIEATGLTVALGPEERAAQFTGQGRLRLGAEPGFEATLSARQIEIDRLVGGEPGRVSLPARLAEEGLGLFAGTGDLGVPGRLRLEVQGLVVGGGAVQEVTLEAHTRAGGLGVDRLEARLPGRSRLEASGRFAFDGGVRFDGRAEVASDQPAALAGWWRGETIGDRLDPTTVSATISAGPGRLRADDLKLEVARAKARGHLDWTDAGARIGLAAERLEFDQVSRLARLFLGAEAARRPASLALDLDAGQMVVGGVVAKGVAIGVTVAADDVAVERLTVQDLAGARLSGSGRIADPLGAPRGNLDLTLDATKPEAPARALATLAGLDAEAADRIAVQAGLAAPLALALRLEGRSEASAATLGGSLRGFAGGAEVSSDLGYEGRVDDPAHGRFRVTAKLAGDKASPALVRLFGGGAAAGALAARLSVEGRPVDGLTVSASARVGATASSVEGTVVRPDDGPVRLDGRLRLATPDAAALGAAIGRPILAFERRIPVDGSLFLRGTWPKLEIGEIAGRVGDTDLRGSARIDLGVRPVAIDGRLDLDRLDLGAAAETLLGGALAGDDGAWATTPLLGAGFDGAIAGAVSLSVGRASLDEVGLDRLRTRLAIRPGEVRLEAIDAGFVGGRIGGEVVLGRAADGTTTLGGRLALDRADLAETVWRRMGRPIASGRLDGEASFAATGRSTAALVAGLGGEGRVRISGARVLGLGGDALAATRVALGDTQPTAEAVEKIFRARLDVSETVVPDTEVAFALQAGVARSGRLVIETPNARLTGRAAVDLSRATLDADGSMEPAGPALEATRTAISKATPSVGFAFRGPIAAPERSLDVAPLVAHLTLSGFEREIERVEALQQDIAERARQARERRRLEEIRAAEEAAKREAEAKRAAEEAARKAADDAARKAAEEAKRATPSPAPKPGEPRPATSGGGANAQPPAAASSGSGSSGASVQPPAGASSGETGGSASLPPLPPPIVVAPPPPVGAVSPDRPLSIVPPGVRVP